MKKRLLMVVAVMCVAASLAMAQTAAEQLQRAIFAHEAQGNIESAITIYRQLATSMLTPREVAAHSQYRLAQALMQKGDLPGAKRETDRLAKDFAEYRTLIDSLTNSLRVQERQGQQAQPGLGLQLTQVVGAGDALPVIEELSTATFDAGSFVTIQGRVTTFMLRSPTGFVVVDAAGQKYAALLAPPGMLPRDTFKVGETVTIVARRPDQGAKVVAGVEGVRAETVTTPDGTVKFDRRRPPLTGTNVLELLDFLGPPFAAPARR